MDDQNPFAAPAELGIDALREAEDPSPIASRGERDFATLVDIIAFVAFFFFTRWGIESTGLVQGSGPWLLAFALTPIFAFFYYFLTEFKTGKSPGKFLARIRVISRTGQMPTRGQFLGRTCARLIPFDSFSVVDLKRNLIYLRDKISGTVVVSDRRWKGKCPWQHFDGNKGFSDTTRSSSEYIAKNKDANV